MNGGDPAVAGGPRPTFGAPGGRVLPRLEL
jgi:hypothetical protein